MTRTVKVDWRVPSKEWEAFSEYVSREHGEIKGYVGREVEKAMREYMDADEFADIEERIDRLLRAAGRRPADAAEEKTLSESSVDSDETTRVRCRVDPDVKDEFSAYVKRETDDRLGIGLTRALKERRRGGRARRAGEKLRRIEDDAAGLLEELGSGDGLSLREKRTIAVCNDLSEQFTRSELESAIEIHAGGSDPTLRDYTERVTERLDVVSHPHNPDLFVPTERAEELASETDAASPSDPAIDRKPYENLTRDEKVHGVRLELARDAAKRSNGKAQFGTADIREEVFDGNAPASYARSLMHDAADADGFRIRSGSTGENRLAVTLTDAASDVLADAGVLANSKNDETTSTTNEDADGADRVEGADDMGGTNEVEQDDEDADAEFNRLLSARTPANAD
ncbi:hypothetical protein SAMN05421858_5127 [Haladaptatus litoreus]|uniref:Uncharacterized protein n=1 Tax=Haladaptatus litoreus TaxID=553468 RepID=A0A1N7FJW1_9EURY|nr:hypothetical protein [Haladaptatus litoreus]SIS00613.1 hypothetical protein SAMN05421858_5127 [Haladaptatus litoreus]